MVQKKGTLARSWDRRHLFVGSAIHDSQLPKLSSNKSRREVLELGVGDDTEG